MARQEVAACLHACMQHPCMLLVYSGVPQGSLGSLLFMLTAPSFNQIESINTLNYTSLQRAAGNLKRWIFQNKMAIDPGKAKIMPIGRQAELFS